MNVVDLIREEDRLLAQLACKKLMKVLQGTISIGLGLCLSKSQDAKEFIARQCGLIESYIKVATYLSVQPGAGAVPEVLQPYRQQLSDYFEEFRGSFQFLREHDGLSESALREQAERLSTAYAELLRIIVNYAELLWPDFSYKQNTIKGREVAQAFVNDAIATR